MAGAVVAAVVGGAAGLVGAAVAAGALVAAGAAVAAGFAGAVVGDGATPPAQPAASRSARPNTGSTLAANNSGRFTLHIPPDSLCSPCAHSTRAALSHCWDRGSLVQQASPAQTESLLSPQPLAVCWADDSGVRRRPEHQGCLRERRQPCRWAERQGVSPFDFMQVACHRRVPAT